MRKNAMFLVSLSFICLICSCSKKEEIKGKFSRAIPVEYKLAKTENVPVYIDTFGSFQASKDVNIGSMIKGQILETCFNDGEEITKGQLLFKIDSSLYIAQLESDKAALEKGKSTLQQKKRAFDRCEKLLPKGVISVEDYEKIKTEYETAKADIKTALAKIKEDEINIQYCDIHSPISGIVGINNIGVGNIVNPGDVLANVKTINPLNIDFTVSETNIAMIKEALDDGSLRLEALVNEKSLKGKASHKKYFGVLKILNNTADQESGTISLEGEIDNSKMTLYPGQFAKIRLIVGNIKDAVLVPREAVRQGPNNQFVYIVDSSEKAREINIVPGEDYDGYCSVLEGKVKAGDKILVSGLLNLTDGAKVKAASMKSIDEKREGKTK